MPHFFRAIALDYDGTITNGKGPPTPELLQAIWDLRGIGCRVVLCTGRIMEELRRHFPEVERHFDAIVAENGAVLFLGGADYPLSEPVPRELEALLVARRVPVRRGCVLLATQAVYDFETVKALRELGLDCQLIRNRGEMMILPAGVTKGTGLREALAELGISSHSALAVGDAENDHALLEACELGAAVGNAVPSLKAAADIVLDEGDGEGVLALLRGPVMSGEQRVLPRRSRISLGVTDDGAPAAIPGSRTNVLVVGGPCSGKSYLAGLLMEQLVRERYSVCAFDPEGDHAGLEPMRGVLAVGGSEPPPEPGEIDRLLRHRFGSLVLDLAHLSRTDMVAYFQAALPSLLRLRAQSGLPHWILIEEADQLLAGRDLPRIDGIESSGFALVTYNPAALAPAVLAAIDVVIATRGGERWARLPVKSSTSAAAIPGDGLRTLELEGRTALLADADGVRPFTPAARAFAHVRHWHKYAEGRLPPERRFHFRSGSALTGRTAASLAEFHKEIRAAHADVLRHHLSVGDFSRWLTETIADDDLGADVRAIERWFRGPGHPGMDETRAALLRAVERRYDASLHRTRALAAGTPRVAV